MQTVDPNQMTKAILTLLLLSNALLAQEPDITRLIQENYGLVPDSAICRIALDSLNVEAEQGMSWTTGAFYASDDGHMSVYHFSGESCGAYCNPFYQSIVSVETSEGATHDFIESDELQFNLDSIVTLKKDRLYLLFGNHSGRPRGVEGVWGKSVVLCSVEEEFEVIWPFESTTSSLVESESPVSELFFNPHEMTISYSYDWYDEMDDFRAYRVSGIWKFNGVTFEAQGEEEVRYMGRQ